MMFFFPFSFFRVNGRSMAPTLSDGDYIFLLRTKKAKDDDIVVLKKPGSNKLIIKRVISHENGEFFVRGDNRKASTDSRSFGAVSRQQIIGRAIMTFKKPR
ncbi:MAG: nickel-type superoxide dismutase maturation protease [Candidatus Hodarchaeales archaeon]|jgi:nickel-type superoxide dismutase maturation protease